MSILQEILKPTLSRTIKWSRSHPSINLALYNLQALSHQAVSDHAAGDNEILPGPYTVQLMMKHMAPRGWNRSFLQKAHLSDCFEALKLGPFLPQLNLGLRLRHLHWSFCWFASLMCFTYEWASTWLADPLWNVSGPQSTWAICN